MKYRRLPGTDLDLSVVGFGCWPMGGEHWGNDTTESDLIGAVHAAMDAGVNWFDTAPLYGRGLAERMLARALNNRHAIIATKVGVVDDGPHVYSNPTRARVFADCEASLRRLNVPCIDLLQIHWAPETDTPIEEGILALMDLQQQGKIRHFGVCNFSTAQCTEAINAGPVVSLQAPYSLIRRELEAQLPDPMPLGVLAYETLCRGLLSGKYTRPHRFPSTDMRRHDPRFHGTRFWRVAPFVADLEAIARKVEVSTAALSIGWVLQQPHITAAIVGMKRPGQVEQNLSCLSVLEHRKLWSIIDRLTAMHAPL